MERIDRMKKKFIALKPDDGSPAYFNCAEAMVRVFNEEYSLGLDEKALKMFSAFGGGMYSGRECGYFVAGAAILGIIYGNKEIPYGNPVLKKKVALWSVKFKERFSEINCRELKGRYGTCSDLGLIAIEEFDRYIQENN